MVDVHKDKIPRIVITQEMIDYVRALESELKVHRTQTSPVDTLAGAIGELGFAQWWYGDWRKHELGRNQGQPDYEGNIEIKTSVYPLSNKLNLPIREDYAEARCAPFYVWACIKVPSPDQKEIKAGLEVALVGWTTGERAHSGEPKKMGWVNSYLCYLTPVPDLETMETLRGAYESYIKNGTYSLDG